MTEKILVPPSHAEGDTCPHCKTGTLTLRHVQKDGPNKGKPFLLCSDHRAGDPTSCQYFDMARRA